MSEWQPIETAPKDGTRFLAFVPDQEDCIAAIAVAFWNPGSPSVNFKPTEDPDLWRRTITENGHFELEGGWYFPTHWMPLPDPPAGGVE